MCPLSWSSCGRRGGRSVLGGGRLVSSVSPARRGGGLCVAMAWLLCKGVRVGVGRTRESDGAIDSGESLARACLPAAAAPVGVAFFLGGVVVVICASSALRSRSSGESQDPGWIRRIPSLGHRLEDLGPIFAAYGLDVHGIAVGRCLTGGEVGVALRRVWQRRWWRSDPSRSLSFCCR